jgi:hypothetical protein
MRPCSAFFGLHRYRSCLSRRYLFDNKFCHHVGGIRAMIWQRTSGLTRYVEHRSRRFHGEHSPLCSKVDRPHHGFRWGVSVELRSAGNPTQFLRRGDHTGILTGASGSGPLRGQSRSDWKCIDVRNRLRKPGPRRTGRMAANPQPASANAAFHQSTPPRPLC